MPSQNASTEAALAALQRGYQPIPINSGQKRPHLSSWTHTRWDSAEQVEESFDRYADEGATGVGLLLGQPSGGLVDVDFDHPQALLLRKLLPKTPMQTGRPGRPESHYWYRVLDELPATRRYKMPDGAVSVELRSTGAQTVIPPSTHPSGEDYRWEQEPWGGEDGPAVVSGKKLAFNVALIGMGAVLTENWPSKGGRHEAYLALAGGMLRHGDGINAFWERELPNIIRLIAYVTNDDDGGEARVHEVMTTTLERLRGGGHATGFPRLGELIGVDHAEQTRRIVKEILELTGYVAPQVTRQLTLGPDGEVIDPEALVSKLPPEKRNPVAERISSWGSVDLEPYLAGEVVMPEPSLLRRTDDKCLLYPGRVNLLFGKSESAKSWVALFTCVQELAVGGRVLYIDFEDGPEGMVSRLKALGVGGDDVAHQFRYVLPFGPLADMQRSKYGSAVTSEGEAAASVFRALIDSFNPTLIVADGMTALYGLHGHDTNEATATEVITSWLKGLCRSGRATVIVIDHTGKGDTAGASPIGAHHKIAMVQGAALRVDVIDRPMKGKEGTVKLVVFKDRPGSVRPIASQGKGEQVAGIAHLDSRIEGMTKMWVDAPDPDEHVGADSDNAEKALEAIAATIDLQNKIIDWFHGDFSLQVLSGDLARELGVATGDLRVAYTQLKVRGLIVTEGESRWTKLRLKQVPR